MKKILLIMCLTIFLFYGSLANATTLVDILNKKFNRINFPYEEVTAVIRLETRINYLKGNRHEHDFLTALKVQEKAVQIFKQNGWVNLNQLQTNTIDAGTIKFEVGEGMNLRFHKVFRLKAYLYQCDHPLLKYRGGDLNKFFKKKVLKKAEYCFTYDKKLKWKNHQY